MSIFQRTVKLVIASVVAIFIAQHLGLDNSSSAGIIAILSILDTRRSSLKMAYQRLLSTLLALGIAVGVFLLFGFSLASLGLYIGLYAPLAYLWQLEAGIAPSTVLVTHLLLDQDISLAFLGNELTLFLLGAGVALIANLYMPSKQLEIKRHRQLVEGQLKLILRRFEALLLQGDGTNDASLISQLDDQLTQALAVVYHDHHNQLFKQTNYHVHYFEMRQNQNTILRQMANYINQCHLESREAVILAHLFHQTAEQLSETNPGHAILDDISQFREAFRQRDLPKTRQEFETRAVLYQLLNDMERLIQLKVDFYKVYGDPDQTLEME